MGHSGVAIAMTAITTAGGLLSFLATGLQPLSALGKFAPLGILLALVYCMVLLPALLAVVPLQRKPRNAAAPARVLERWVVETGDFSARHPAWVLSATALIIGLSLHGVTQLRFSNDIMRWLPEANPLRSATRLIDQELGGSMALEVVVDTGRENGVKSPDFLAGLEEIRLRVAELRRGDTLYVGRSISIADVVKEIHQALNENRSEYYAIPQDAALVAQELLLFENTGNDDLEDLVDTRFSLTRFSIKVPYVDPIEYDGFIEAVESEFREVLGESVEIETTGFMGMMGQTMHHVIFGLARSYGLALLIITPLMMLLLSDLRIGLASMIPNLTPILLSLGLMGWLGVRIDMFTMMIGSIAIGLVVDDTIHFMHGFRRNFAQGGDARQAVRETLETTGQALLFTSLILATGFLIFAFSQMENLSYFGLFTSLTIAAAFLIDILVSPALMVLATRAQHADGDPGED
jgi:predicted RND superfamily exporter protein